MLSQLPWMLMPQRQRQQLGRPQPLRGVPGPIALMVTRSGWFSPLLGPGFWGRAAGVTDTMWARAPLR